MKKLCMYGLIAAILLFGAACSDGSTAPPEEKPAVILEEIDEVLPNPFKGFVPLGGIGEYNLSDKAAVQNL